MHRIFTTAVADVYPHYVAKIERKGQSVADLDTVICWLTGYDGPALHRHLKAKTTFEDFFAGAQIPDGASLITGSICGVKIVEIEDPLMRKIRQLDKVVDEVGQGRPLQKIMRTVQG